MYTRRTANINNAIAALLFWELPAFNWDGAKVQCFEHAVS